MVGSIGVVWMTLVLIASVQCNTEYVINSIPVDSVKEEILRVEQRMMDHIDSIKISLETEFKQQMNQQRKAMEEFIKGDSFKDVLRSEVVAEIKQLKREQNKINRQFRRLIKSLTGFQQDREFCKNDKQKDEIRGDTPNATTLTVPVHKETTMVATTVTPSLVTTSVTTQATPLETTLSPSEMRNRIIVVPLFAHTSHQFLEVNIDNNGHNTYPLRSMDRILSVAYASKLRKLLIATYKPNKIIASPLDTDEEGVLLEGVMSYGMAVDEDKQIIFLTTASPEYSVSRMTTKGENFTRVTNLTHYGYYPRAIAVDSRERKIYSCNHNKVFTVFYDGQGLQTLATGRHMNTVALDDTGSILYYNHDNVLKKLSLSENVTTTLSNISVVPWTSRYYRNTIYFSSGHNRRGSGMIGAVNIGDEVTIRTLHSFKMNDSGNYAICLVP